MEPPVIVQISEKFLNNAAEVRPSKPLSGRASHPRFRLIVRAKEASMSGWRFLCRTRLNPVLPPYPH